MINIDYIMELISWNKSVEKQEEGIKLAQQVKCINVFLQPCNKYYGKNVWDNCAKILTSRSNEELSPYITELLLWLRDLNWPGALLIFERIKLLAEDPIFQRAYNSCIKCATALDDTVWKNNLEMLFTVNSNE